jgi:hypothetical protein
MSQEMNKNEKPTTGKNENVENPLTKMTPERTGDKPAEIIYREIRIVEPSPELVQELKNKDLGAGKHIAGLGHDKTREHNKPLVGHDKPIVHDKPLGHDSLKDKGFVHDKPLVGHDKPIVHDKPLTELKDVKHVGDKYHSDKGRDLGQNLGQGYDDGAAQKFKETPLSPRDKEHFSDKFGAGKPVHDLGHDGGHKVKTGPADLSDKLHGERLKDKKYGDVPTHDKDAYVGKKPGDKLDDDRHVGDKHLGASHLPYPAEYPATTAVAPRHVGVGDKEVIVDDHHPAGLQDVKHVGDKYHSDKGRDLGQNLGQGYDDGAGQKFKEKPLSPRVKHDKHKKHGLFGKKHDHDDSSSSSSSDDDGDKQKLGADGQKRTHLFGGKKRDADGRKHKKKRGLFGKKHDHDKHKLKDPAPVVAAPVVAAPVVAVKDVTPDMNKVRDGDVLSNGEKVKDKYELTEADHIGDKYISKKGWDLGQNLGKRYDDADTYKLKDEGRHYVPDNDKKVEIVPPTVHAPLTAPVVGAPVVAVPAPAATLDERIAVPSAHGERVYSHEHKDGDRPIGDKPHLHREEGGILSDEHRLDKMSGVPPAAEVAEEPHKKPGVIGKVIEKVKEKFSSSKSADTTPDPVADKGQHWEKVPDERTADGGHWKDRSVEGDRHKSKETY